MRKTELLIPAGSLDVLKTAVIYGADAVYLGGEAFGLRAKAKNFTNEEIMEGIKHLKGLKIGIMGCIVNGPGEMADADYGYVGAGPNKVSLYRKQVCIEKNIPQEVAVEHLLALIDADKKSR